MKTIPTVDLADFTSGDAYRKEKFVQEIGNAYHEVGFVTVKNHGIDEKLIEKLYEQVKAFFNLPIETKKKYEIEELAGQRGYTSFGREHAKDSPVADLKEFYHVGQEVTDDDPIKKEYPDNIFPDTELPEFRTVTLSIYQQFENTGRNLLRALAIYLKLDEFYFDKHIHNGNSILRPIHYPPIETEIPEGAVRAGAHEDINLITLLIGASADGLQVLTRQGEWIPVTALPGQIVVNAGDMLQRLTNNVIRSTTHRVVNPPKELLKTSRYSIPFFLHPRSDMDLTCLPHCITEDNPKQYQNMTAGEYLNERLIELGLKK